MLAGVNKWKKFTKYTKKATQKEKNVVLYTSEKENQYLVEIEIDNLNFAKDVKVPENTKSSIVVLEGNYIG